MKKGLRKLILSGTALAAVAATLGTSTYAWYTANETVSATDISGASAGAADASIFISKDHSAWSSTVALDQNGDVTGGALLPVEYVGNTTDQQTSVTSANFKDLGSVSNNAYVAGNTRTVANGAAKKFTLYFRSSKISADATAPTVYLKGITLTNTTEDYTPADNLFYTKTNGYGVNVNQATYGVDFTQALKMVIYTDASDAGLADGNVNGKSLDLVNYQSTGLNSNLGTINADNNALTYYNNIMSTSLTSAMDTQTKATITEKNSNQSQRTAISLGQLNKDADYITVDFYIYLDGWDTYCYDACKGQSFQLDLEFTSDVTEALTYAA